MSARHRFRFSLCVLSVLSAFSSMAAEPMDRSQIEAQKLLLQTERDEIATRYTLEARLCWQRFRVNDCLQTARAQRRQALGPIDKQEQALRAAQRALMVIERQERLRAKQPDGKEPDAKEPVAKQPDVNEPQSKELDVKAPRDARP
jgi:hypothetical protein